MIKEIVKDYIKINVFKRKNKEIRSLILFSKNSNIISILPKITGLIKVYSEINMLDHNNKNIKLIKHKYSFTNLQRNFSKFNLYFNQYLCFRIECYYFLNRDIFSNNNEISFYENIEKSLNLFQNGQYDGETKLKVFLFYVNLIESDLIDDYMKNLLHKYLSGISFQINYNHLSSFNDENLIKYGKKLFKVLKIKPSEYENIVKKFIQFIIKSSIKNTYLLSIAFKLLNNMLDNKIECIDDNLLSVSKYILEDYNKFKIESVNEFINFMRMVNEMINVNLYFKKFNFSYKSLISYFFTKLQDSSILSCQNKIFILYLIHSNNNEEIRKIYLEYDSTLKNIEKLLNDQFIALKMHNTKSEKKMNEITKQLNLFINKHNSQL